MSKKPIVSVLVPNFNHAAFLKQRIESILNQSFQDFEIILLDDASNDGSIDILKRYAHHPKVSHFVVNKVNSGSPFKQWQKGILLAEGEYIWIAESDDYCKFNFLEELFKLKDASNYNLGLIYAQSYDVDENGGSAENRIKYTAQFEPNIWKNNFNISGREFIEEYLKVKNVIPNASAVIFKKSLIGQQIFSKDILEMKMCGDWLFWIKLCVKTDIGFVSEPLNYFRSHGNMSRNHSLKNKKRDRLLEESVIRRYLKKFNVAQQEELDKLLRKWFDLHAKNDVIKMNFFKIESAGFGYFQLLKKYLLHILNKRKRA